MSELWSDFPISEDEKKLMKFNSCAENGIFYGIPLFILVCLLLSIVRIILGI